MIRRNINLLNIILPLIIGAMVYILYRPKSLLIFEWLEILNLSTITNFMRYCAYPLKSQLPNWVIYSLPNGLWLYSLITTINIIWNNQITSKSIAWIILAFFIGIFMEYGQYMGVIKGTFDKTDLVTILIFGILAFIQAFNFSIYNIKT